MTKRKILAVDDNDLIRNLMKTFCAKRGYQVITASNGKIGLNRFKQEGADLVLTDFEMPKMNGGELYQEIRQLSPACPIYLMSAGSSNPQLQTLIQNGANFLQKPFGLAELDYILNKHFNNKNL